MRDPKRIDKILKDIKEIWEKHPDTRLGQLILNLEGTVEIPIYHMEDEELVASLKQLYSHLEK